MRAGTGERWEYGRQGDRDDCEVILLAERVVKFGLGAGLEFDLAFDDFHPRRNPRAPPAQNFRLIPGRARHRMTLAPLVAPDVEHRLALEVGVP